MFSTYDEVAKHQEKCIQELKQLQQRLDELPKKLNDCGLQKLNSVCFVPAKIYHTNEIMVHLGNDYFVERTSFQARDIAERRIKVYQKNLDELKDQKKKQDKIRIVEIKEPVQQVQETKDKHIKPQVEQQQNTTKKIAQETKQEDKKQDQIVKQSENDAQENSNKQATNTTSSLSHILSLMNKANFKMEDYVSDEELEEDQDDVEIEESEEQEKIQIKSSSTPTQKSNLKKQASNSQEKRKSVQFGESEKVIFEPTNEQRPEDLLKQKDQQIKDRIAKLDQRAKELGKEEEEQQQKPVIKENIMDKIKPQKEESQKASKKKVKHTFDEEEEEEEEEVEQEQPKKISKFKQRMMEQKK
ncbi:hypothetical protein ABPG72_019178 [Tetrahymena utriculariae]